MNGNRASGLKKGNSGPSLHGGPESYRKGIAAKGDFRQASHTVQKMQKIEISLSPNNHELSILTTGRYARKKKIIRKKCN